MASPNPASLLPLASSEVQEALDTSGAGSVVGGEPAPSPSAAAPADLPSPPPLSPHNDAVDDATVNATGGQGPSGSGRRKSLEGRQGEAPAVASASSPTAAAAKSKLVSSAGAHTRFPTVVGVKLMASERSLSESEAEDEHALVEFGREDSHICVRMLYAIERDLLNWYGSIISLVRHGWSFEAFLTICCAVASTSVFCLVPIDGHAFAARLDFTIIGSAFVFPTTFLIAETFRRREGAIQRLASIKALLCQLELAYLTWRWKGDSDMGEEWELEVHKTMNHTLRTMVAILTLPTWNTNRHIYTASGREFKAKVVKRERELMHRIGVLFARMHVFTEDLKAKGLPPNEASRINQYNCLMQVDFEALVMVKCYRTPNIARSFVRIMLLVCPIFYGPYFAWVSGLIGGGAQTNFAFALALTLLTVFILLGLVRVQRAMEDPFTSNFPGDVIEMRDELNDTEARLELILGFAQEKRLIRGGGGGGELQPQPQHQDQQQPAATINTLATTKA